MSSWFSLPELNLDENDRPRKLTNQEIEFILKHVPFPRAADAFSARVAREGMLIHMRDELKKYEICPSSIDELISNIIDNHNRSSVIPGNPVGIAAAEALGSSITQMTLNSVVYETKILISIYGQYYAIEIGKLIDYYMDRYSNQVVTLSENQTEYLELENPFLILTVDSEGNISWEELTGLSRHVPVNFLYKIKTKSGRLVVMAYDKSCLVWNYEKSKFESRDFDQLNIGDCVPLSRKLPLINNSNDLSYQVLNSLFESPILDFSLINIDNYLSSSFVDFVFNKLKKCSTIEVKNLETAEIIDCVMRNHGKTVIYQGNNKIEISDDFEIQNDTFLDPIVSISKIFSEELVYDVTVPKTTNFVLYNGLGVVDTFHSSGSITSASSGIMDVQDLIYARPSPRNEYSVIHFTDRSMRYEDVLNTRSYIVGSIISDFVKDYEIRNPNKITKFWWYDLFGNNIPQSTQCLRLYLNVNELYKHRVTIRHIVDFINVGSEGLMTFVHGPIVDGVLDIYPNNSIFSIPNNKARKLNVSQNLSFPPNMTQKLFERTFLFDVVYASLKTTRIKGISGIEKIFPKEVNVIEAIGKEERIRESDINTEIMEQILRPAFNRGSAWFLYFNDGYMKIYGIKPENLSALAMYSGINVLGISNDYLAIEMPDDRYQLGDYQIYRNDGHYYFIHFDTTKIFEINSELYLELSYLPEEKDNHYLIDYSGQKVPYPKDSILIIDGRYYRKFQPYINSNGIIYENIDLASKMIREMDPRNYIEFKVNRDRSQRKLKFQELERERDEKIKTMSEKEKNFYRNKPVNFPETDLMRASMFYYIETKGIGKNFSDILSLPGVDKKLTYCNNVNLICDSLGIEAGRLIFIKLLKLIIANTGSYIHDANIMLIGEFVTNRGRFFGATYSGISRQQIGHLSLASLERAGKVFINSAIRGVEEDSRNVSAAILCGSRVKIGTGYFDVGQNITVDGTKKIILNDELFTEFKKDDDVQKLLNKKSESKFIDLDSLDSFSAIKIGDNENVQLPKVNEDVQTDDIQDFINRIDDRQKDDRERIVIQPINAHPKKESKAMMEEVVETSKTEKIEVNQDLQDLLDELDLEQTIKIKEYNNSIITINKSLPEESGFVLPDLSKVNFDEIRRDMNNENNLQPINVSQFQQMKL